MNTTPTAPAPASPTPAPRVTTWGTSHFENRAAAVAYYLPTEGYAAASAVLRKLAAGEIHLGPPDLKPDQRLSLHREERRFFITEGGK